MIIQIRAIQDISSITLEQLRQCIIQAKAPFVADKLIGVFVQAYITLIENLSDNISQLTVQAANEEIEKFCKLFQIQKPDIKLTEEIKLKESEMMSSQPATGSINTPTRSTPIRYSPSQFFEESDHSFAPKKEDPILALLPVKKRELKNPMW